MDTTKLTFKTNKILNMKQILYFLLSLVNFTASAQDFTYTYKGQTLTYTVLDEAAGTCKLKNGEYLKPGSNVSGNVIIPSDVKNGTVTLKVTEIGELAFSGSSLTSVVIPNSITSIGNDAFNGCSSLTSVEIPNSITSISNGAFLGCTSLTSIEIPNSIVIIDDYAFYRCSGLTSVKIPKCTIKISRYAFSECSSLRTIYLLNPEGSTGAWSMCFDAFHYQNTTLYVPQEALEIYKTAVSWKEFQNIQGFDYTELNYSYNSSDMTATVTGYNKDFIPSCLVIPSTITFQNLTYTVASIADDAFRDCDGFTSVEIPNSITSISKGCFAIVFRRV